MTDRPLVLTRRRLRAVQLVLLALVLIVLGFAVHRAVNDILDALAGAVPDDDYARRDVAHPWLAYLHIAPGVVYLLGALLRLSYRFRSADPVRPSSSTPRQTRSGGLPPTLATCSPSGCWGRWRYLWTVDRWR